MIPLTIPEAAKFLDKVKPRWEKDLILKDLDLSTNHNCLLAQLFGSYSQGLKTLFPNSTKEEQVQLFFKVFGMRRNLPKWIEEIEQRCLHLSH